MNTELIDGNNCEENSFNRLSIGHRSVLTIFHHLLLLSTPLDNGLVDRKTGFLLSANVNIICSATLSHSPCGLYSWVEYHFFSDPGPRNDHCPAENLSAKRETS